MDKLFDVISGKHLNEFGKVVEGENESDEEEGSDEEGETEKPKSKIKVASESTSLIKKT